MVAAYGLIGSSTASAFVLTAGVSAFDSSTGSIRSTTGYGSPTGSDAGTSSRFAPVVSGGSTSLLAS